MNARIAIAAVVAACAAAPQALAQQNPQAKSDRRAFTRIADLFADFDGWHGPVMNFGIQPQLSWTYSEANDTNVVTGSLAMSSYTWITPTLTTVVNLSIDQVRDPDPGETLVFNGEGFGVDDLYFNWSDQRLGLQGGIFTVPFGFSWNTLPGVFDGEFVGDYQFDGRVGALGLLSTGNDGGGVHALQFGAFTIDGSFLSKTVLYDSGPAQTDGVVGGDDGASWLVSYTASDVPLLYPSLNYQVSFLSQSSAGDGGPRENGLSAGLNWTIPIIDDVMSTVDGKFFSIAPSFEYVHFWDWQGVDGANADYFTPGVTFAYGDWEVDLAATWRNTDDGFGNESDDLLLSATLGYTFFSPQVQMQVGYAYQEVGGVDDHLVGVQVNMPINVLSYALFGK
ncbi:MAG: hypothetical protein JNM94_01600 [Phycisphaerae bacterium]|nr:hypothetical protein [Phycisphaerae bacterium]